MRLIQRHDSNQEQRGDLMGNGLGPALRTRIGLAAASVFAGVLITACTTTSYSCSGSRCEVTLSGNGASTELGPYGEPITLLSVDNGVATISLAGAAGSCSAGDTIELAGASVECTAVGSNDVALIVTE